MAKKLRVVHRRVGGRRKTRRRVGMRAPVFFIACLVLVAVPAILVNQNLEKWEQAYRAYRLHHQRARNSRPVARLNWTRDGRRF